MVSEPSSSQSTAEEPLTPVQKEIEKIVKHTNTKADNKKEAAVNENDPEGEKQADRLYKVAAMMENGDQDQVSASSSARRGYVAHTSC